MLCQINSGRGIRYDQPARSPKDVEVQPKARGEGARDASVTVSSFEVRVPVLAKANSCSAVPCAKGHRGRQARVGSSRLNRARGLDEDLERAIGVEISHHRGSSQCAVAVAALIVVGVGQWDIET